ncbi:NPCBM/NEW2 domain-containing protein [Massilia rhizosphaerae]|uniref:NPCBM/NEW2 domain-containing protein n=1 Tax=Massilia rhizosphaerae TaxID=2784389 RepID=UPI0018DB06FA|nr:NPCBM/NEW2 domain-containing protein [Massilia rhizosphaerae]
MTIRHLPRRRLAAILALAACAPAVHADDAASNLRPSGRFSVRPAVTAATPPMGWNPWNAFHTQVTEAKIMAVAQALKSTGLADAGYRYVNMDDGWWLKRRADGRIEIRTSMFPSAALPDGGTSFRPYVERLHSMGLKAGLYTEIGRNACSQAWDEHGANLPVGTRPEREIGTYGHQAQDMRLFYGEWGFDYVKVDACGVADFQAEKPFVKDGTYRALGPYMVRSRPDLSEPKVVERLYADLRAAIDAVRPDGDFILSICNWGEVHVADWGKDYGQMWRTSQDISANWWSMLHNFDSSAGRALYAGPGHWNDPDMLEVGLGEFDADHPVEARAHMSLWAIVNAPLVLGADLSKAPPVVLDIIGKREVIAINQDPAGNQGVIVARTTDTETLVKSMAQAGTKALALINRSARPQALSVALGRLNLDPAAPATMRDLWTGQERAVERGVISAELAPHETRLLLVRGVPELKGGVYLGEMPARINVAADGRAQISALRFASWAPAQVNASPAGTPLIVGGKRRDNGIGVLSDSRLEVRLDKEFSRFRTVAGANDDTARPLTFRVYGDGKLLFEQSGTQPVEIDVPVRGVRTLELVVEGKDREAGVALATWADARLMR